MRAKRGQLLILVLGVMALGLFVTAPLLAFLDLSFRLSQRDQLKTSAYYAAEAGVERVIGDLYMGTNVLAGNDSYTRYVNESEAVNQRYMFHVNVTEPEILGLPPLTAEKYLDPGSCLGMTPIEPNGSWDFDLFMTEGEDMKVNWVSFFGDSDCLGLTDTGNEHFRGVIRLLDGDGEWMYDQKGNPIAVKVGSDNPATNHLGSFSRTVAVTLFVDGAFPGPDGEEGTKDDIINIESGPYTFRFINRGWDGNNPDANFLYSCATPYMDYGDDDYIFSGSLNCAAVDCSNFINGSNYIWLMAFNENHGDIGDDVDTNTFFCDYVQINVTTWGGRVATYSQNRTTSGPGFGNRSFSCPLTTDFGGGGEGNGTSVKDGVPYAEGRYYDLLTQELLPLPGGCAPVPFAAEDYDLVEYREGLRFEVPDPTVGGERNALTGHLFRINESWDVVRQIDVEWEGYQHKAGITPDEDTWPRVDDDELALLIWNWTPPGSPEGAGNGVAHVLDHRAQPGGNLWAKLYTGAYKDYLVESWSYICPDNDCSTGLDPNPEPVAKITCYVRQSPGPSTWWQMQAIEILSWNIYYYP